MQNDQGKRAGTAVFDCHRLIRRHKENSDLVPVHDDFLSYYGIRRRRWSRKNWHVDPTKEACSLPKHLEAMVADYTLAMAPTDSATNTILPNPSPPPIEILLHMLLAEVRRARAAQSDAFSTQPRRPFWGRDQVISLDGDAEEGARGNVLECEVSYALWYGDPRLLETNCVVIQAERPIAGVAWESVGYLEVLAAMSLIQHNRFARRGNPDVYGIFTDGFVWMFFHLNKGCKYSSCVLNWKEGQRGAILCLISRIIRDAATLCLLIKDEVNESSEIRSTWNRSQPDLSENKDYMDNAADNGPSEPPNMEWFTRFENRVMEIVARRGTPKDIIDAEEAFRAARAESQKSAQQQQPLLPKMAVTDIPSEDLFDIFGLRHETAPGRGCWALADSEERGLPSHLGKLLHDWDEVFRSREENEIIRSRLNSIIVSTLAARRREGAVKQHGPEKEAIASTRAHTSYRHLRWVSEKPVAFKWRIRGKRTEIRGRMDYALWYGSRKDLDTNLLVVQAKGLYGAGCCVLQVITFMAIIHHVRRERGRTNAPIYGIATDSMYWYFVRLHPDGVVSKHVVDWNVNPMEFVSQIHKIMDHAAYLASRSG
ncbi:hypothetical protein BJY00DRAFT_312148 [Aspergillus carlsbadensis]|nr:hypothetical protein BJY00DRAFT_312148 [Aspergillus carlsbadensis]